VFFSSGFLAALDPGTCKRAGTAILSGLIVEFLNNQARTVKQTDIFEIEIN